MEAVNSWNQFQTQLTKKGQELLNKIDLNQESNIVELGAGQGTLTFNLARNNPESQITAIESERGNYLALKQKKTNEKLSNLRFYQTDPKVLNQIDKNSIDYVIANFLARNYDKRELKKLFKEVKRVLKENGKFYLSDFVRKGESRQQKIFCIALNKYSEQAEGLWKEKDISKIIESSEFKINSRESFAWKIKLTGKGVYQFLENNSIRQEFSNEYEKVLSRYGLSLPKSYLIKAEITK